MTTRVSIDEQAISQRIEELTEDLAGTPHKNGECDGCHCWGGLWPDVAEEGCGDFEFCRRCLHKELIRLRALRRMGIRTGGVR